MTGMNTATKLAIIGIIFLLLPLGSFAQTSTEPATESSLDPYFKELQKNPDFKVFTEKDNLELPLKLLGQLKQAEYQYNTPWYGYLGGYFGTELTSTYDLVKTNSDNTIFLNYNSQYYILERGSDPKVGDYFRIYHVLTTRTVAEKGKTKKVLLSRKFYYSGFGSDFRYYEKAFPNYLYSEAKNNNWDVAKIINDYGDNPNYDYTDFVNFGQDDTTNSTIALVRDLRNVEGENFANEYVKLRSAGIYVIKENDDLDKALDYVKSQLSNEEIARKAILQSIALVQKDHDSKLTLFDVEFFIGTDQKPKIDIIRYNPATDTWVKTIAYQPISETIDGITKINTLEFLRSGNAMVSAIRTDPRDTAPTVPVKYSTSEIIEFLKDPEDVWQHILQLYIPTSMEIKILSDADHTVTVSDPTSTKESPKLTILSGDYSDPSNPVNDSMQFIIQNLARTNNFPSSKGTNEFDQKLYITMTDFKGKEVDLSNVDIPNIVDFDSSKYYSFKGPANNCHPDADDSTGEFYFCRMNIVRTINGKAFEPGKAYTFYYYYGIKDAGAIADSDIKSFQIEFPPVETCTIAPDTIPDTKVPVGGPAHSIKVFTVGDRTAIPEIPSSTPTTVTVPLTPTTLPTVPTPTPTPTPGSAPASGSTAPAPTGSPSTTTSSPAATGGTSGITFTPLIKISQNSGIVNPISSTDTVEEYQLPTAQPFQVFIENLDLGLEEPYIGAGGPFGWGRIYYGWLPGTQTTVHKNFYLGEISRFHILDSVGIIFGNLPSEGSERMYSIPTSTGILPMKAQAVNMKIGDTFNQLYSVANNQAGLYNFLTNNFNGSTYYAFSFETFNGKNFADYFSTNPALEFSYYYDKDGDGKIGTGEVKTVQIYSPTSTVTAPPTAPGTAPSTLPPGTSSSGTGTAPSGGTATSTTPGTATGSPSAPSPTVLPPTCAPPKAVLNIVRDSQKDAEYFRKLTKRLVIKESTVPASGH